MQDEIVDQDRDAGGKCTRSNQKHETFPPGHDVGQDYLRDLIKQKQVEQQVNEIGVADARSEQSIHSTVLQVVAGRCPMFCHERCPVLCSGHVPPQQKNHHVDRGHREKDVFLATARPGF